MNSTTTHQKDQMLPSEYLKKPYSRIVVPDESTGTFAAYIAEFPGCIADGSSAAEAIAQLEEVAEQWVALSLESGQKIPEPYLVGDCSGKFALRLPRSLHQQSSEFAAREGVSLNQFFAIAIAQYIGAKGVFYEFTKSIDRQVKTAVTLFETTIQEGFTYVGESMLSNACTVRTEGRLSIPAISVKQVRH